MLRTAPFSPQLAPLPYDPGLRHVPTVRPWPSLGGVRNELAVSQHPTLVPVPRAFQREPFGDVVATQHAACSVSKPCSGSEVCCELPMGSFCYPSAEKCQTAQDVWGGEEQGPVQCPPGLVLSADGKNCESRSTVHVSLLPTWYSVASTLGSIALAYHGYKRTRSVGWAVGWAILGGMFWPIAVPIAVAQGFGKPESSSMSRNAGRRARRELDGYAYELTAGRWRTAPDDNWDIVMVSHLPVRHIGGRVIDGSRVHVLRGADGKIYAATHY